MEEGESEGGRRVLRGDGVETQKEGKEERTGTGGKARGVGWEKRQENIKGEMKGVRQKGWEQSRRGR